MCGKEKKKKGSGEITDCQQAFYLKQVPACAQARTSAYTSTFNFVEREVKPSM
jgi:hypothetical protein